MALSGPIASDALVHNGASRLSRDTSIWHEYPLPHLSRVRVRVKGKPVNHPDPSAKPPAHVAHS